MTRILTALLLVFVLVSPAAAQRPRPLGWAIEAAQAGNWDNAARIAARDGQIAADVIEWMRLRAGRGSADEVRAFLARRPDWPGIAYLRRQSEAAFDGAETAQILDFFDAQPPATPKGALIHAAALRQSGQNQAAEATLIRAWQSLPMDAEEQAAFVAAGGKALTPHHRARLDALLWGRHHGAARQMFDLLPPAQQQLAEARIALQRLARDVDARIAAVDPALQSDPGLQHDRFEWRIRKSRSADAVALLRAQSKSAQTLGQPEAWANRRRALARAEMRQGRPWIAYELAAQHHLTAGRHYADLEWLAGYIALRFLKDPAKAHGHFLNHDSAVQSPISQGRAGYWQGRALEALGDAPGAAAAYAMGARYQTSFYGLLAAERAGLPFDPALRGRPPAGRWQDAPFAQDPLFQAGLLLQASGQISLAERFWTHLAESLEPAQIALLGQAAIELNQPHIAVMIGKRAAQEGLIVPAPYYPLHPMLELDLPMAPEMNLAIARRESEFDPVVISHAGARGLMQLMPGTARDVAADLGLTALHATDRLTQDPDHNARLGAAYLAQMAAAFDGNVVMVAAAYNAGPRRPTRWMQLYGDPRQGKIDVVDWIEMVPFRETRNYIMRVTESLPVYRARLGLDPLPQPFSAELLGQTLLPFAPKGE